MPHRLLAVLTVIAFATAAGASERSSSGTRPGPPAAQSIEGVWHGRYHYPNNVEAPVPFELRVTATNANAFEARTSEPNTFADSSVRALFANISGVVTADGAISFTKTYDGTGGVWHSVNYNGTLSPDRRTVTGHWSIPDAPSGRFEMRRAN